MAIMWARKLIRGSRGLNSETRR